MPRNIAINSQSSGRFSIQQLNGRDHIVTKMVSLESNSVMNGLAYPKEAVESSYMQLNALPAPASHPIVNGERVSASHPMAVNSFNIGAMVMNPAIEGERIINDLVIDKMIAEKDDRGMELIKRIENGEKIGVSTGLTADILNQSGEMKGRQYNGVVSNINFDHVAILLNELPAGQNTYTVNADESAVIICNVDQSAEQKPRAEKPIQTNHKVKKMEQEKLVLSIIANSGNTLTESDQASLMGMSEMGLVAAIHNSSVKPEPAPVTAEEAVSVVESEGMFAINSDEKAILDSVKAEQKAKQDELINKVVANSKMSKEQLENMDLATVESIAQSINGNGADFSIQAANVTNADKGTPTLELHEDA